MTYSTLGMTIMKPTAVPVVPVPDAALQNVAPKVAIKPVWLLGALAAFLFLRRR